MKHLTPLLLLSLLAALLSGCAGSKPSTAARAFFEAMDAGDSEKAMAQFAPELTEDETMRSKLSFIINAGITEVEKNEGLKSFQVLEENVEGDTATVQFKVAYNNGEEESDEMKLRKVDGKWYLLFD